MSTYEPVPRASLSFGDLCQGPWLHDVHVTDDSRTMREHQMGKGFAMKLGYPGPVDYYVPNPGLQGDGPHPALARGVARNAVVITDDCVIASALGREGEDPSGRLLFAPVTVASSGEMEGLARRPTWSRFALEADEHHAEHTIVELRRCFMADARTVAGALHDNDTPLVERSLSDATRDALAVRWSAYANRRGVLVAQDNATKIARALTAGAGLDRAGSMALGNALASVVAGAWAYEGRSLERGGDLAGELNAARIDAATFDAARRLSDLEADLCTLRDLCDAALAQVDALQT